MFVNDEPKAFSPEALGGAPLSDAGVVHGTTIHIQGEGVAGAAFRKLEALCFGLSLRFSLQGPSHEQPATEKASNEKSASKGTIAADSR